MKCIRVIVSGKVQGVSYRRFARDGALRLGIRGWVQNLDDGRVEAYALGDDSKIDEFVELLRKGPILARVDSVDVRAISENEMDENHVSFDIRR